MIRLSVVQRMAAFVSSLQSSAGSLGLALLIFLVGAASASEPSGVHSFSQQPPWFESLARPDYTGWPPECGATYSAIIARGFNPKNYRTYNSCYSACVSIGVGLGNYYCPPDICETLCNPTAAPPFNPINLGCSNCTVGEPINPAVGNLVENEVDFRSQISTLPLNITRTYNSKSTSIGLFGAGWVTAFDSSIVFSGGTAASVTMPDGKQLPFTLSGGTWTAGSTIPTTMVANASGFLVTTVDREQYQYNGGGQLLSITDGQGDSLTIPSGQRTASQWTVNDNYGNSMVISFYSGTSFVKSIQVAGQSYTYQYGFNQGLTGAAANNLMSASYSITLTAGGKPQSVSRQYLYENAQYPNALTGLIDETGQRYSTWTYDINGLANSSQVGTSNPTMASVPSQETYIDYTHAIDATPYVTVSTQDGFLSNYYITTGSDGIANISEIQQTSSGSQNVTPSTTYTSYNNQNLPSAQMSGNGNVSTMTYFPVTQGDNRSLLNVKTDGQLGTLTSPTPTSSMKKTTYASYDPIYPEPTDIIYSGSNAQGTLVQYREDTFTYNDLNGRMKTHTETDQTNYTSPYSSHGKTRSWGYNYSYYDTSTQVKVSSEIITGPLGDTTELDYNNGGELYQSTTKSNDSYSSTHTYQFSNFTAQGLPQTITDVTNGNINTTLTYNERNQITSITKAAGTSASAQTTLSYYPNGLLQQVTRPDGFFVEYFYDSAHQLIEIDDGAGNKQVVTPSTINGEWNVIEVYNAANAGLPGPSNPPIGGYSYYLNRNLDDLGRLLQQVDSAPTNGGARSLIYDLDNNIQQVYEGSQTSNNPTEVNNLYDTLDRLTAVQRPGIQNLTTTSPNLTLYPYAQLVYGETGQVEQVTQLTTTRTLPTTYTHDGLNNLMLQQSPDSGLTQFWHDAAGNTIERIDNAGNKLFYTFDNLSRLREIDGQTPQQTAASKLYTYTYDQTDSKHTYGYGRLTSMSDSSGGSTDWSYDAAGRILSKVQVTGGLSLTTSYAYVPGTDDVKTVTLPSGSVLTYLWNQGYVTEIDENAGKDGVTGPLISQVTYEPFGSPLSWTLGNAELVSRYYDNNARVYADPVDPNIYWDSSFSGQHVTSLGLGGPSNIVVQGDYTYTEDNYGHVTGLKGYTYNSSGKQINVPTLTYSFDTDDNRLTSKSGLTLTTFTLDPNSNRYSSSQKSSTTTNYSYDQNGSLTKVGTSANIYSYDVTARLISYGGTTYTLNGLGQRVEKLPSSSSATVFLYDEAGRLIGEYNGSTGSVIEETVYLGDMPIAVLEPGVNYYVHADYRNTPRQIDDKNQAAVWAWDPKVFGDNPPNQNPPGGSTKALTYNLRFPGQYYDSESGTFYNYFRDYNPALGRYLESDPVGLSAGINPYAYVGGNPLLLTDGFGLTTAGSTIGGAIGGWLGGAIGEGIDPAGGGAVGAPIGRAAGSAIGNFASDALANDKTKCGCDPATPANIMKALASSSMFTYQKAVSLPVIQVYSNMIEQGSVAPPISVYNSTILEGNHRYIAALLCHQQPTTIPGTPPISAGMPIPIQNIILDPVDWGNR